MTIHLSSSLPIAIPSSPKKDTEAVILIQALQKEIASIHKNNTFDASQLVLLLRQVYFLPKLPFSDQTFIKGFMQILPNLDPTNPKDVDLVCNGLNRVIVDIEHAYHIPPADYERAKVNDIGCLIQKMTAGAVGERWKI